MCVPEREKTHLASTEFGNMKIGPSIDLLDHGVSALDEPLDETLRLTLIQLPLLRQSK